MARKVKTPTILQVEAVECGAAALGMILAFHGRWIRLEDLRIECGVSRDGATAANIIKCARRHGLEASGKRLELHRLADMALPVIVFVNMNHFVVVEAISSKGYRLNDPAIGRRWVSAEEFDGMFTGVTLIFEPGPEFERTKKPAPPLRDILATLVGEKTTVALILIAGLCLILTGLILPAFTKVFIDDFLMAGQRDWLWGMAGLMVLAIALLGGLTLSRDIYQAKLQTKLASILNTQLVWRLIRLPIPFFGQRLAGSLAGRTAMASQVATMAAESVMSVVLSGVALLFFAAVLALYSPLIAIATVGLMALNVGLVMSFQHSMQQSAIKVATEAMTLQGKTFIGLQSIESIKSSGTEDRFFQGWSGSQAQLMNAQMRISLQQAVSAATPAFTCLLTKIGCLVIGGLHAMEGEMSIGAIVACLAIITAMDMPFQKVIGDIQVLVKAKGPIEQVNDILNYPQAREFDTQAARQVPVTARLSGHVTIEDLSFGYSPMAPALIQGFDLDIPAGKRVALVGSSGSGKSTIGKVLTGLLPATGGRVLFDGIEIADLDREVLRSSIAVVDQNVKLFAADYRENIRLWEPTISDQEVILAAQDAEIHDLIASSQHGYSTLVEEGGRNISGGQRQRIEIARALAMNAPILVLDEATSALDPVVEARVMANIARRHCTCIVIAHRLSTIRDCDEILVLNKGKIIERGSHDALMVNDGPYRALLAS